MLVVCKPPIRGISVAIVSLCLQSLWCAVISPQATFAQTAASPAAEKPRGPQKQLETTQDWNRRLEELLSASNAGPAGPYQETRIGPDDLLEISVFGASELNRSVRVPANGSISLPLVGAVKAAGLKPQELELVLQELLRRGNYIKDPHVAVFIRELESHSVSILGAVRKPGVFQIRGSKTVLEMLSMAEGLAEDAGDTVTITGSSVQIPGAPKQPTEINLKGLLQNESPDLNVAVFPGDIVTVNRAGVIYVIGEVRKPGGFVMRNNESISVLQALALAEGLTKVSSKGHARIIRTNEKTGQRAEIAINLEKILNGKLPDPLLEPKDIVFVPGSAARSALYRGTEAAISIVSGVLVFRR